MKGFLLKQVQISQNLKCLYTPVAVEVIIPYYSPYFKILEEVSYDFLN